MKSILSDDAEVPEQQVEVIKDSLVQEEPSLTHSEPIQPASSTINPAAAIVLPNDQKDIELELVVSENDLLKTHQSTYLEEGSDEQLALLEWASEHRSNLSQVIDESLPESVANVMKLAVFKDNAMLETPLAQQENGIDDAWAYLTEQKIRDHIFQHNLGSGIDLLSVTCKQLMCDILAIEREAHAWFEIYKSLYQLPQIRYPDSEYQPTNVQRVENGIAYGYGQIMFNPDNQRG